MCLALPSLTHLVIDYWHTDTVSFSRVLVHCNPSSPAGATVWKLLLQFQIVFFVQQIRESARLQRELGGDPNLRPSGVFRGSSTEVVRRDSHRCPGEDGTGQSSSKQPLCEFSYWIRSISCIFHNSKQQIRSLSGMQEVSGSNPLGGNILCNPTPSEKTINRSPNNAIPTTHALICEELKDPGNSPKVVP